MRTASGIAVVALAVTATPAAADTVEGRVLSSTGRLVDGGRLIVTDVTVRTPDGRTVTVLARGGRAGGLGQWSSHSPPIPEVGDAVRVQATSRGGVLVVDDLEVTAAFAPRFVRTGPTEAGHYLAWASGCVFMTTDADGTADLPGDEELGVIDGTLAAWNDAIGACSYLQLQSAGTASADPAKKVGNDGVNRIVFRDDRWCRPAHDSVPETCLPSGAAGLTTVTYVDDPSSSRDGEIVDADVELNGEQFSISANGTSLGDQPCLSDLANTLTHELGHVMGLDHTCLAPGDPPKVDGNGDPVPLCAQATDPVITEATMYNYQDCGETKKQSPEQDDVTAVCTAYPVEDDPGTCAPVGGDGTCCGAGGGDPTGGALVLVSALAAAAYRRRRSA